MRNPGKGRLLTFEPSSGNWRKNLGTDIRNGSVKRYPIPIMGNDTVNGILPIGRKAINPRIVIGSLIIKHKLNLSDEETVLLIRKNPYM